MSVDGVLDRSTRVQDLVEVERPPDYVFDPNRDVSPEQWETYKRAIKSDNYVSYFPLVSFKDEIELTIEGYKKRLDNVMDGVNLSEISKYRMSSILPFLAFGRQLFPIEFNNLVPEGLDIDQNIPQPDWLDDRAPVAISYLTYRILKPDFKLSDLEWQQYKNNSRTFSSKTYEEAKKVGSNAASLILALACTRLTEPERYKELSEPDPLVWKLALTQLNERLPFYLESLIVLSAHEATLTPRGVHIVQYNPESIAKPPAISPLPDQRRFGK